MKTLRILSAALLMILLAAPGAPAEEKLDLSLLDAQELSAAATWEDAVFETRPWYERADGTDWRVQDDGSVIVTISATGDVTIGGDTRKSSTSIFDKQLAQEPSGLSFPMENVRSLFEADDMTIVNFEGTLTTTKSATKNTYSFAAPPEYVQVLTSGSVEAVSLENNHILDHGAAGYEETCQTLEAAGIRYSGHLGASTYTTDTGVTIGMLSYQTFNGNYTNIYASIEGDIAALRAQGCQIVIVSYHWGEEKDYIPNERQVPLGRATIDAGADLVLGHHSHRMNPIEVYNGKYICYSLGNFSFAGNIRPDDMDTFVFQQRFRVWPDGTVQNEGFRIVPCSISSQEDVNDFKPTPQEGEAAQAIVSRLLELNADFEKTYKSTGVTAVDAYPTQWMTEY
ncbi:MAG: CapA family protein [Clostridiales bacterium]|nr:CapA family protein [Clostridiales bacterium]MDY5348246.1 CapA family protein [Candidatus Ventricola sp.]MDY5513718.1 CapA family protein [Candidatus Ventricola sp.]